MAMLKNQEVWYVKCDPARPDKGIGTPEQPAKKSWNIQLRTSSKDVRKEWLDLGLKPKTVRAIKDDEESPILYYTTNVRKSAEPREGKPLTPVSVVNGKQQPVDPNTIGNGSICNLNLFKREYKLANVAKVQYILMGIQVVLHKVYVSRPMETFDDCETEVIMPEGAEEEGVSKAATPSGSAEEDEAGMY